MIHVIDNWVLIVDENNYIIAKYMGDRPKKQGGGTEPIITGRKYYTSLTGALNGLREQMDKEVLAGDFLSLTEAFNAVRDSNERLSQEFDRIKALLEGDRGAV